MAFSESILFKIFYSGKFSLFSENARLKNFLDGSKMEYVENLPSVPINAKNVKIISEPRDFYETLLVIFISLTFIFLQFLLI